MLERKIDDAAESALENAGDRVLEILQKGRTINRMRVQSAPP